MEIEQREWNQLVGDVGFIRAKVEDIHDLPERVSTLEAKQQQFRLDLDFIKGKGARTLTIGLATVAAVGALTSGAAAAVAIFFK